MSQVVTRSKASTIILKQRKKCGNKLRRKIRINRYQLMKKIGAGSFSWVYSGVSVSQPKKNVAIKTFFSTTEHQQALNQIQLLFSLRQKKRFPKLLDVDIINQHIHIIYSLIQSQSFQKFYKTATLDQIKHYLYELLLGLSDLKEAEIVHRDIKPSNFLYNDKKKRGFIIDFGFATKKDAIIKKIGIEKRKGTMAYMPLEVFLQGDYSYASDIWAVGIIMLELLIKKTIIFHTLSDNSQKLQVNQVSPFMQHLSHFLVQLALFKGNQEIINQCKQFGFALQLPENIYSQGQSLQQVLSIFHHSKNAVDLLSKLLEIDPKKRIEVEDALTHPFFDDIRANHDKEQQNPNN